LQVANVQPSIFAISQPIRVTVTGRNFFNIGDGVSAGVFSAAGLMFCACSNIVFINDFSFFCVLESELEFKGFFRVRVYDQMSAATQESSVSTIETKSGLQVSPSLPFFQDCNDSSRMRKGSVGSFVKQDCSSCCNPACLSAHPQHLVKRFQVRRSL
jgi:hypothetical protein